MLDAYAHGPAATSVNVTYDYVNDRYPNRQDAAKVTIPADQVSLKDTIRLPIPPVGDSSLLVTWDSWWGREFERSHSGLLNYKNFQLASGARIWTQVNTEFDRATEAPGALAMFSVRQLGESFGESPVGANVTDTNPLSPYRTFAIMPETWTRYWAYFNPVANRWFEFSMWVADETHSPVKTIDRLLIKPDYPEGAIGWEGLWLEYNTSSTVIPPGRGPLVGYARNVVMLRSVSDPTQLLERPVR
jgi:hypothetical protein